MLEEHDANFLNNYAMFLKNIKNNTSRAETVYKKLLASQPSHGIAHGMCLFCAHSVLYACAWNTTLYIALAHLARMWRGEAHAVRALRTHSGP